MQLSKKKIERARVLYPYAINDTLGFKKYAVIEELKEYGVTVDPNSDLDAKTINRIFGCVIEKVISKYGLED